MKQAKNPVIPLVSLTAGVIILGFSAIFVRTANAPSVVINFYRMGIGALILSGPFYLQFRKKNQKLSRSGVLIAVAAGVLFSLDLILWSAGVQISGATNPTLMANTAPIWVGLGAALLYKERRRGLFWAGLAIALIGTVQIVGLDLQQSATAGKGTLYGLVGGFFYGTYLLLGQKGRDRLSVFSFFWIVVFSATLLLGIAVLISGTPLTGYSRQTYWSMLGLGVLVQSIGWILINYAQGYLPAAIVSPTLLGQPVITALLSFLLLQEKFTARQGLAGAVVIFGVFLVHHSRRPHKRSFND